MPTEASTFLALLLLALALLIFAFAIVYNVGESARNQRRQQNADRPPTPPVGGAPSASSRSSAPFIRWGQEENQYEDEPSPAARGLVWGEEGLEPRDPEPRGPEPAWNPIRPAAMPVEQEKCPFCRRRFSDTATEAVVRCGNASCRTYVHQECLRSLSGQCPICHGTQFVAATV